jgi:hypothetical protein
MRLGPVRALADRPFLDELRAISRRTDELAV